MTTDRLCRPIMLETPNLLSELSAWNEHTPFAFWLVDALRPKFLVELGTHSGVSYCAFCQAISHLHLPTQCYAVDTWEGDAHARTYGEDIFQNLKTHHDPRYGAFSTLMRTTFDNAANQFQDASIDLLHIDGFHTYDAARHDFETWLPKMSPAGVILFHDIAGRSADFGVWRLWEEISARFPSFHFIHASGLGVAAVGPQPPEPVRWLSARAEKEIAEVRSFFSKRGALIRTLLEHQRVEAELGRQLSKVAEQESEIAEKDSEIANLQAWGEKAKTVMDEQAQQVAELRALASAQQRLIDEAIERRAGMAQEVGRMAERLGAAHQRIEELNQQTAALSGRESSALAAVYASTSWRITAPLRALSRAARSLIAR